MERARGLLLKNTHEDVIDKNNLAAIYQPNQPGKSTNISYTTIPKKDWDRKEVEAALEDLNKAIGYDPQNREAYILRAQAKMILKKNDHCPDILHAKKLGIADAAQRLNTTCN